MSNEIVLDGFIFADYGCPPGWINNFYDCYKVETTPQTFALAQDSCAKRGTRLVVIEDEAEYNFVTNIVK